MSVVAFAARPHPTANQPKKDLYEVGEIPPLGHVPKNMYAWVIRRDRHGPPEQSMQLEVVPTHAIGEDEVLVLVMAAGVNYNGVWAGLGLPISPFDVHKQPFHIAGSDAAGIVWAIGAKVIGVVSSDEKAKLAKAHGAKWTINTSKENFVERVKEITKGRGVPVVYDSIGKDTWSGSLDCLQTRGLMVSFGNASGPVGPVDLGILSAKGSLYVTRPTLMSYTGTRPELLGSAKALFKMVGDKKVKIRINQTYALKDAAQAHADLAARKTTGSTVLIP